MSVTNMNANTELTVRHELQAAMREPVVSRCDDESTPVNAPQWILRSVLAALSEERISEAVAQFSDRFKFNDHGVALEFTDKPRLTEFFEIGQSNRSTRSWPQDRGSRFQVGQ
jgi:hypothetical protein